VWIDLLRYNRILVFLGDRRPDTLSFFLVRVLNFGDVGLDDISLVEVTNSVDLADAMVGLEPVDRAVVIEFVFRRVIDGEATYS